MSNHPEPLRTDRRAFIKTTTTAAGAVALGCVGTAGAGRNSATQPALVDVNVNVSRWPLRRLPLDDPDRLVSKLRQQDVSQAWAGSLDGLLARDIRKVNAGLAADCRRHGRGILIPVGTVDPTQPDWEEDLRLCVEEHRMPGVRLHPGHHGYTLDDPRLARLLDLAGRHRLFIQVALLMEDERMMHPKLRVTPVDPAPLVGVLAAVPGLPIVLLNALGAVRDAALGRLISAGQVHVEIAMLEGVGGLERLLERVPLERVLFGSHAPLFYIESALLKLKESPLGPAQLEAIRRGNARRLLPFHP